jgi:multiple sugar transport system substrate-binding protein
MKKAVSSSGRFLAILFPLFLILLPGILTARELKVWIMPNTYHPAETFQEVVKEFTRKTGIPVKVEVIDWGSAFKRIEDALSNQDNAPNLLQLGSTWLPYFADRGYLARLSGFQWDRFYPEILTTCRIYGSKYLYGVPWFIDVRNLYINNSIFSKTHVGIKSLSDYSGFENFLYRIKQSSFSNDGHPVYPYGIPGKYDWNVLHNFSPWIWSQGGDYITNRNGIWQSSLLEKNTVLGIYHYLRFVENDYNNHESLAENTTQIENRFARGEFTVISTLTRLLRSIQLNVTEGGYGNTPLAKQGIRLIPYPSTGNHKGVSFIGGSDLSVPRKFGEDPDTLRLLEYLTTSESLQQYCNRSGFIPVDTNTWASWAHMDNFRELLQTLRFTKTYPNIPNWGEIEIQLVNCFGDIMELYSSNYYNYSMLYDILNKYDRIINGILNHHHMETILPESDFVQWIEHEKRYLDRRLHTSNPGSSDWFVLSSVSLILLLAGLLYGSWFLFRKKKIQIRKMNETVFTPFILILTFSQLALILSIIFILIQSFRTEEDNQILDNNRNLVKTAATYIHSSINSYSEKLLLLSDMEAFQNLDRIGIVNTLVGEEKNQIFLPEEKLFVLDIHNQPIADNSLTIPYVFSNSIPDFSVTLVHSPDVYISELQYRDPVPKLDIAVSINSPSVGAIVGEYSLRRISDFIRSQKIGKKGFIVVADTSGRLLTASGTDALKGKTNLIQIGIDSRTQPLLAEDKLHRIRFDGKSYLLASAVVENRKILILVLDESQGFLSGLAKKLHFVILSFGIVVLITVLLSQLINRTVIRPVNRLSVLLNGDSSISRESVEPYMKWKNEISKLFSKYYSLMTEIKVRDQEKNDLIAMIENQNRELSQMNETLEKKVRERTTELDNAFQIQKQLNQELLIMSDELQSEKDQLKKRNAIMENELEMARKIQRQSIPSESPVPYIAFLYKPMDKVGGDFFDFIHFQSNNWIGIFISDVSGHGVAAAYITSMIKSNLLQNAPYISNPASILELLNGNLIHQSAGNFITAFYGIFKPDTREFLFSNAGHNPPYIINNQGIHPLEVRKQGIPLAVLDNEDLIGLNKKYTNQSAIIPSGSKLLLYTDGLTESVPVQQKENSEESDLKDFESVKLSEVLADSTGLSPQELILFLNCALIDYRGLDDFEDDVCIICLDAV